MLDFWLGLLFCSTGMAAAILFGIANAMICKNSERRMKKQKPISKTKIGVVIGLGIVLAITSCIALIAVEFEIFTIPVILLFISLWIGLLFDSTPRPCKPFRVSISITLIAWAIAGIIYLIRLII